VWDGLSELPAVFPDGSDLDEKIYPWLLNALLVKRVPKLRGKEPRFHLLQEALAIFLGWVIAPLTILAFYLYYLEYYFPETQDKNVIITHIAFLSLSVWFSRAFYVAMGVTLAGRGGIGFFQRWILAWRDARDTIGDCVECRQVLQRAFSREAMRRLWKSRRHKSLSPPSSTFKDVAGVLHRPIAWAIIAAVLALLVWLLELNRVTGGPVIVGAS